MEDGAKESRILLLAPTSRDAQVSSRILREANLDVAAFPSMSTLLTALSSGAGVIVLTDHPIHSHDDIMDLRARLTSQPRWSEIPVICLARGNPLVDRLNLLRSLPGIVLLERPVSTRTFSSAVSAALRARWRQYELREQIHQLHRANVELTGNARAKDEFLATLAHELRNPLGALANAAKILNQSDGKPTLNAMARQIFDRQVAHMTRLLDDLLDVARITHQRLELRKQRCELSGIIEAAVETVQPLFDSKGHDFQLEVPSQVIWVWADPIRIAQVVSNLLSNAAKYTEDGGRIQLSARAPEGWAEVNVRDNGIGIAPEKLASVFGMFTQLDSAIVGSNSGLGIGLALARGLIQLHGGTICAHSEGLGKGSLFSMKMPLAGLEEQEPTIADIAAAGVARKSIVLADDNVDSLSSLAELLSLQGHRVRQARNGVEALQFLETEFPEVMLLDIGMPGMSGLEVARTVRSRSPNLAITLIALSGKGQPADKALAREAGFDQYLTKPVDLALLQALLSADQRA